MIAINSVLHFIIDAICAFAMFGSYGSDGAYAYLFYNLCAFVLQLPIGAVIDLVMAKLPQNGSIAKKRFNWTITSFGVLLTLIGMYAGPFALGVGNALFHAGGGTSSIIEDREKQLGGRGLGIFVAPGALGLFAGRLLSTFSIWKLYIQNTWIVVSILMILVGILRLYYEERHFVFIEMPVNTAAGDNALAETENMKAGNKALKAGNEASKAGSEASKAGNKALKAGITLLLTVVSCFAVVIIRSYVGLAMSFDWNNRLTMAMLAAVMVALGKAAGGFTQMWLGRIKTVCISLWLAGIAFFFSDIAIVGLFALFFFNMTMPITLNMLAEMLTDTPGIAFGLLSLGLFIGFLPVYFELSVPVSGVWVGVMGSLISLGLLLLPIIMAPNHGKRKK